MGRPGASDMVRYGLEGVPVMVTGAANGIGLGIARAFATQGARLALVDRDLARLEVATDELTSAKGFACDLADDQSVAVLANQPIREFLTPAQIAGTYLFLASEDARPITGQALVVSNGELMH